MVPLVVLTTLNVSMDKLTHEYTVKAARPMPVQDQSQNLYKPRLGELVMFFDRNGKPFKGTIRWIGKHQGDDVVGVEAVSEKNKHNVFLCIVQYENTVQV